MFSLLTFSTGAILGTALTTALLVASFSLKAYSQANDKTKMPGTEGIRIMNVDPGSVFDAMKVESGDVLLEVESRRVKRIQEIEEIFRDLEPGTKVKYKVEHGGKVEDREMEYKKAPAPVAPVASPTPKK